MALDYVKVIGKYGVVVGDGADLDDFPDTLFCDSGTVTFTPLIGEMKVTEIPAALVNQPIIATINSNGELTYGNNPFIWLLDLGSSKISPNIPLDHATYRVSFKNMEYEGKAVTFADFAFHPLPGQDNDLALMSPVQVGKGQAIVRGLSAYELDVQQGFVGTLDQWLDSLRVSGDGSSTVTTAPIDMVPILEAL